MRKRSRRQRPVKPPSEDEDEDDSLGLTPFQLRVLGALMLVPEGSVVSYAALAAGVGCASSQAIGQALRRNPYPPNIPCHRALRSDRSLGGFQGQLASSLVDGGPKACLLRSEDVPVEWNADRKLWQVNEDRLIDRSEMVKMCKTHDKEEIMRRLRSAVASHRGRTAVTKRRKVDREDGR